MAEKENLPPAFFQHFYQETLFVPALAQQQNSETERATNFTVTGENKKHVTLVHFLPEKNFEALAQNTFLINVLKAINLNMADVGLVNVSEPNTVSAEELLTNIPTRFLLIFGQNVLKTPQNNLYQPFTVQNSTAVLAEEVNTIQNDRQKKALLWKALQQMFL